MFDLFVFPSQHRAPGRQSGEGRIQGQGYLPFRWRGGQPELLRRGKKRIYSVRCGFAGRWKFFSEQKRAGRKSASTERIKNRRNREDESAFTRRCFPLSSAWDWTSERLRESAGERERERLRVCVSEAHWIQRTGCWSAPPPLRFTLRRSWRKQEDVRVTSGVM